MFSQELRDGDLNTVLSAKPSFTPLLAVYKLGQVTKFPQT